MEKTIWYWQGKKLWWILFGDLLKSIESWKVEDGFKSGINAYVVSREGHHGKGREIKALLNPLLCMQGY